MGWKTPAVLALLLLAAATPAAGGCPPNADGGQFLLRPLELTGRPQVTAGLTGQTLKTLRSSDGANGCRGPLPAVAESTRFGNGSGDVLHGLPAPDLLRPIDESSQVPRLR